MAFAEIAGDIFIGQSMGSMEYSCVIFAKAAEGGYVTGLKIHVRDGGSWHEVTHTYVKISGTWTEVTPYIKNGGVWYTP